MSSIVTASETDKESIVHNERVGLNYDSKLEALAELDEAAIVLQNAGHVEFSIEEDRRVLRLVDLWVLSKSYSQTECMHLAKLGLAPMCVVYFLQQMDKSAVRVFINKSVYQKSSSHVPFRYPIRLCLAS